MNVFIECVCNGSCCSKSHRTMTNHSLCLILTIPYVNLIAQCFVEHERSFAMVRFHCKQECSLK